MEKMLVKSIVYYTDLYTPVRKRPGDFPGLLRPLPPAPRPTVDL